MKKLLKWAGFFLLGVLGLLLLSLALVYAVTEYRFTRKYDIPGETLQISAGEGGPDRAQHLEDAMLDCTACHGKDFGGGVVLDEPGLMSIYAPNLTAGPGGAGASFTDADWVRAVRHGVGPDGKALLFMPADIFNHLSDEDLAAIIAYARSFPPVDNQVPESNIGILGRVFILIGQLPETVFLPARHIDHGAPSRPAIMPAVTSEYGAYLVSIAYCTHCHRQDLGGGPFPFPDPEAPAVPSLASAGSWPLEAFMTAIRTGERPSGTPLDPEYMPWQDYNFTDDELQAIWLYLQTLPVPEPGSP